MDHGIRGVGLSLIDACKGMILSAFKLKYKGENGFGPSLAQKPLEPYLARTLGRLARDQRRAVLLTIHQPSSRVVAAMVRRRSQSGGGVSQEEAATRATFRQAVIPVVLY